MSKHYKKLVLLLIPACAGFCLALTLGSAEEQPELCHLCYNKALVKEAILAFDEDPADANLPEQFDPNYVQYGPYPYSAVQPTPHTSDNLFSFYGGDYSPISFKFIIAEGDKVAVHLEWCVEQYQGALFYRELAIYRIANGKIIEGWTSRTEYWWSYG